MSGFVDRAARYPVAVPVRFHSSDGLAAGQSVDVSASGMLVTFDRSAEVWLTGDLAIELPADTLHIPARVARVSGREAGLSFRPTDEAGRATVDKLLAFAEAQGVPPK